MRRAFTRAITVFGSALFFGLFLLGCEDKNGADGFGPGVTVARVGDRSITLGDLELEIKRYETLFKIGVDQGSDRGPMLREAILTRLIDDLILQIEADRLGIIVSDSDLQKETSALLGKYDAARLELKLAENKMSFDEWKQSLMGRIKMRKLTTMEIDSTIVVSEKEVKAYFKEHAHDFKWPMRVRALQIMVEDEVEAEKIRKRLLNGANFDTIAKETSQSPDAVSGGDLGFVSRGQLPPEFEVAIFNLKEGEVSEVIKSIYGFHLFKVVKIKKLRAMTYAEARKRIQKLIFDEKREEVFKNWTVKIKKSVDIEVYPERLSRALP